MSCLECGLPALKKFCSQPCYWQDKRKKVYPGQFQPGHPTHPFKGENASYQALHQWVNRNLGSPRVCSRCGTTTARAYDWANISGEYHRTVSDWIRLCRSCHHRNDNQAGKRNLTNPLPRGADGRWLKRSQKDRLLSEASWSN